ncbi:plasmid partitioning protein RepB [Rhizobium sp. TRM95796]|uniref:plasmid partitioning protein RepB n=1 Tax=Rhizobium sp. TRM95796 TaxID=2979862 RepID=UPI0021E82DC2|nr:plasmid partitioning protein RepB [Rhizobium sp. TRM95796]MCV3767946.1 plasmid partitioning protein RepB [Rhizobium sp. TRM95796]
MAGRDRKNSLKALFGDAVTPAGDVSNLSTSINPEGASQPPAAEQAAPPRAASGAIKAMGLSLTSITREAEEARVLRQALEEGERIVSLDTEKISGSFVSDRLSEEERDDPDFLQLVDSVRESGQQQPILVRPHPEKQGHYQVAYGHRRLRAVHRLGLKVKAVIRNLTDSELVLAQGKENAERRNLSFIERALFAKALIGRGFERKIACDALAVQKSELSRLLQVADSVPDALIRAIGPAPKIGRERWMALGQLFDDDAAKGKAEAEIASDRFRSAESDERFQMLFERVSRKARSDKSAPEALTTPDGKVFARVNRQGRSVKIEFSAEADQGFIEAAIERMTEDYARFLAKTGS